MTSGLATRTIGVAIAIPEPWAAELQARRVAYGDPNAARIPTHITLFPPTPVDADALDDIDGHLQAAAEDERPFDIQLRGTGTFRPVSPVVFVALACGIAECEQVEERVRSGPLARERRFPFHPHVTVAHDLPGEVLDLAYAELASYQARFRTWGFSLYEHGPDGMWRPMRDFPLGRGVPGPPAEGERRQAWS